MNNSPVMSTEQKVVVILAEALQVSAEHVTTDLQFGDLPQWDSMGHMEVMILLEQHFGIEINADTIAELTSVAAINTYLKVNQYA